MKISKVIIPLVVTTVLGFVAANKKSFGRNSKILSDKEKFTSESTVNRSEKTFGGLKQAAIDEIVSNTARAVKAMINGDKLDLWYTSASGKSKSITSYTLDSTGKLIGQIVEGYSNANTPHIFAENLKEAMKQAK
ncbi:hypothetical protein [Solibacillus sp. FSL K6-1126]|uniref:hypothetical protein n=1 Tax=Solibacillus sp. FSL K6-1126 TaxID=2921463 RepID=UPI0030F91E9C